MKKFREELSLCVYVYYISICNERKEEKLDRYIHLPVTNFMNEPQANNIGTMFKFP